MSEEVKIRKPVLRWRRQSNERGLASIGQLERGYDLRLGGECVASVRPHTEGFSRVTDGWYWHCGADKDLGIEYRNTCSRPVPTIDEAKAQAMEYVRGCLGK